ncbi:MAG: VCBS repeat-containing protein [Solirubrobacterales bacterium]|nr:VCBS repeat-containing protein [Solirubrobacterales bacterium]
MKLTAGRAFFGRSRLMVIALVTAAGVLFSASQGFGSFDAPNSFPVGNGPEFVAADDLNGDGSTDLVTANTTASTVSVLLGDGAGSFSDAPDSPFAAGGNPRSVAIGNLNGGSVPDLVVTNPFSDNVSVLLGDGDGSFGPPTSFATGGDGSRNVAIGNFNTDGFADLAITNPGNSSVNVSILLGNGTGSFSPAPGSPYPVSSKPAFSPSSPFGIAISNFNGGRPDLVVGSQATSIYVMFGNEDGSFSTTPDSTILSGDAPATPGPESVPQGVAAGDLNADGFADIVAANRDDNSVSVILGNGDGTFDPKTQFNAGTKPVSVAIGNLNGGSVPDLAVANADSSPSDDSVSVLLGTGGGSFGAPVSLPFPSPNPNAEPLSIGISNLNGDSLPDLFTASSGIASASVFIGTTAPTATISPGRIDFDARETGTTSAAQTLTFTNTAGTEQVEVGAITITGGEAGDFSITEETCAGEFLLPQATCEIDVNFTPAAADQRFAELQVAFNGASSPLRVTLAGVGNDPPVCPGFTTGTPPDCDPIPCPAGFTGNEPVCVELKARISKLTVTGPGKIRKGKRATYTARITNSGNIRATGVKLSASGKGISSKVLVGTVEAGVTRTVKLRIRPSRAGPIETSFRVSSGNAGAKSITRRITVKK